MFMKSHAEYCDSVTITYTYCMIKVSKHRNNVCVWHHNDYMMTVGKNVLHFIMETFKKVEFFLCLKMHHVMKVYGGLAMHVRIFWTLALYGDEWSVSCPVALPHDKHLHCAMSRYLVGITASLCA
jgi:hypothetical protein